MGLCGYGKVIPEFVPAFEEFFFDRDYEKLSNWTNLPLKNVNDPWKNPLENWTFEGQYGYDIAATAQEAFENAFFSVLDKYDTEVPLIVTGGCALNVLVNEKIKSRYNRELFSQITIQICGCGQGKISSILQKYLPLSYLTLLDIIIAK